jgi:soluble lytic murein transglycosylase
VSVLSHADIEGEIEHLRKQGQPQPFLFFDSHTHKLARYYQMKQLMRWSLVLACSTTLVGAAACKTTTEGSLQPNNLLAAAVNTTDLPTTDNSSARQFDLLTNLPQPQRLNQLQAQAQIPQSSLERSRARYILANLHLANRNPQAAISSLAGLETEYPVLADYVLLKRAQALTLSSDSNSAKTTWQQILSQYPKSPVAAEALFALGQSQQLLEQFPSHPRSRDILLAELRKTPNSPDLLASMAVNFRDSKEILPILDRLVSIQSGRLTPDQWWAIAEGYYDNAEYGKASLAFARATPNPPNAYRLGRSLQRNRQKVQAIAAYGNVVQRYPNSPQAPRALIRMMDLSRPEDAVKLADLIVAKYPNTAGEALLKKADFLRQLGNAKASSETQSLLLNKYASSDAAAELSWRYAKQHARSGQLKPALNWVNRIVLSDAESEIAAEAAYWGGKWATRIGDRPTAQQMFRFVLTKHPKTYFAWRSASQLGWQVGDFTTVRNINLPINRPSARSPLPTGTPALNELYHLGQDRDASEYWQFAMRGRLSKNVKETLTDGIMRIGVNDNIKGIAQAESLNWLDVTPAEQAEIDTLKKQPIFWQTVYPFPYWDRVSSWSEQRNLSPILVMGLIRQESRFEAEILSRSGAVGLMQIMPDTGRWIASKKGRSSYSLKDPEHNIEFGTWYFDYTHREFGDNSMLAIASYNAGPGAIGRWVKSKGIGDPDEFVEGIPYDETRGYVYRVFGNYWNYMLLYSPQLKQRIAQLQAETITASSNTKGVNK